MASLAQPSGASTGPDLDNRRVAAALIDLVVPATVGAAAYAAGLSLTRGVLLVAVGWTLYYFFALESGDGQTLGKRAMKLRVVSADGSPASMEQIAKRTVVRILDGHIVGLIVMLATGERRQRLGDIVAGTVVADADADADADTDADTDAEADAPPRADEPATEPLTAPPAMRAAPPRDLTPGRLKRSLSLPSIRLPSLPSLPLLRGRSAAADGVPWYRRSMSMPSLRRRTQQDADGLRQTAAADPAPVRPAPVLEPRTGEPSSRLQQLDALPPQGARDQGPEPIEDFMQREVVIEREPDVEPDARNPYDDEPLAGFDRAPSVEVDDPVDGDYETVVEYEADVERTVEHEAAPYPDEPSDDHVVVKPIETVSAIDLVMQDAEDRRSQ